RGPFHPGRSRGAAAGAGRGRRAPAHRPGPPAEAPRGRAPGRLRERGATAHLPGGGTLGWRPVDRAGRAPRNPRGAAPPGRKTPFRALDTLRGVATIPRLPERAVSEGTCPDDNWSASR